MTSGCDDLPIVCADLAQRRRSVPTTKRDAALREAIFIAADHARRIDPTLAARYQRLMVLAGKLHNSAVCHIATTLLTRIVACWRSGERYIIRDRDGRPVSAAEGRRIVTQRHSVPAEVRRHRLGLRAALAGGRIGAIRSRTALRRRPARSQRDNLPSELDIRPIGSEFRARVFGQTVSALGARQRFIQASRASADQMG